MKSYGLLFTLSLIFVGSSYPMQQMEEASMNAGAKNEQIFLDSCGTINFLQCFMHTLLQDSQCFTHNTQTQAFIKDGPSLDEGLIKELMQDCPAEILSLINVLQNPTRTARSLPKRILLVGPPGTGKTTFANLIASQLGREILFISAPFLSNEYKNSGQQNLFRAVDYAASTGKPFVVIIDEITVLTDESANKNNPDKGLAEALWTMLDTYVNNKNLVFIATTNNVVESFPEPLKDLLSEVI